MNFFYLLAAASPGNEVELSFIWGKSTLEGKIIIGFLLVFSIFSWSVMVAKAVQMRRAKKRSGTMNIYRCKFCHTWHIGSSN